MDRKITRVAGYTMLSQVLFAILAIFFILYIGQSIIIPLIFSTILALLINPIVNYLVTHRVNNVVAILLSITLAILAVLAVAYFIITQAILFVEMLPSLQQKLDGLVRDAYFWAADTFHLRLSVTREWARSLQQDGMSSGKEALGQTLISLSGVLVVTLLVPVYMFMILYYKRHLLEFIARLFKSHQHAVVAEVLLESRTVIQKYLIGLLVEAALVATLNTAGLMALHLQYALLLGVVGALLNIIPYIGGIIGTALPMMVALATRNPSTVLWVLAVHLAVQFIDNNLITPRIVASRVKINGLISIIVVFIGGALWGIPGMFLSIPMTAIIKVVFDRIEPLTSFGFLLGDEQPSVGKVIFKFKTPPKTKKTVLK